LGNEKNHYATFSFEKTEAKNDEKLDSKEETKTATVLLKNLERALRNEQVLREVGSFIISDLPIQEIAQKIAKVLCEHLKVDRCLIHDYRNGQTSFVAEHQNEYTAKILDNSQEDNLKMLVEYINFQNHFFERYGNKEKKNALFLIEDVESDQNFEKIRPICEKFSIASQIAVTTIFNKKVNGGIYIHQSDKKTWLTDEIELLEMVANQFSIAIDRSESIERVMVANHSLMERTSQLKEALKQEKEMRQMQNEFVALVSHEFKTPLQIIDGTRELLVRKIRNLNIADDSLNKAFERIKSGIQRMNGLIHSTLNLAKMESGESKIKLEKQVFDLKNFVFEIIEKNSNLAINKQIKIITKIDELPTEFEGDPKLLDHSITNIISNAIKYSKNNTSVKIFSKSSGKKVALRVIDQGIGIPKEDLANIGQKFFRAKNTLAVAGTGIGVYLTKHFIELHEGKVLIESEVNVGTSVTITLPNRYTQSNPS
jgi:signal transduction histidine kinase